MKRTSGRSRVGWAVLGLLVAVGGAAHGQDARPGVFGEVLDVRVVNVEVVVTDKQGIRVRGLGPEAFRLLVDGEEVPIDYFSEIRGGIPVDSERQAGPSPVPALESGQRVGVSYLLFVDDYFSETRDRDKVLDELRQQLAFLRPEDRMAVVAWDGRQLEMLSSWSQSHGELDDALKAAQRRPAFGLQRDAELRSIDATANLRGRASFAGAGFFRLTEDERYETERLLEKVERATGAAAATLRAFANPPGRKVMLLLSGGWPMNAARYVVDDNNRTISPEEGGDARPRFRHLTDTANLLGYTIYTVDVPGFDRPTNNISQGPGAPPLTPPDLEVREREVHFGLEYAAERTGGTAFLNARRLEVIEEVALDTSSYYWLGFTAEREGADEQHDIEVEVVDSKLRVRARDGFHDTSRSTEATLTVESALLFGNAPSTRSFPLELGEYEKKGLNKALLPVAVGIPLDELTLVPVGDEWVGEVELRIAVRDENGSIGPIPVVPLVVRRDEEPAPGTYVAYRTTVKLRRAPHDLVVTLFDPVSGRLLAREARFDP